MVFKFTPTQPDVMEILEKLGGCRWSTGTTANNVGKVPSARGQGIAGNRRGYLRAAKSCYNANAAFPVLRLTAVLVGLHVRWLALLKSSGWARSFATYFCVGVISTPQACTKLISIYPKFGESGK